MKKPVKIILWIAGIILGLVIIVAVVFYINFRQAIKSMTPEETGAINDSVWCIKNRFVNAYIFRTGQNYIMVDAGIDEKNFKKEMEKIGIIPDQITTLLLTHTDGDHTGATALFKNAAIYMHQDEKQMIDGTTSKPNTPKEIWKYGPYKLLGDNDSLYIGGIKIKILHTPGHTTGSSCYIIGKDYLVTGDNLVLSEGRYEHFIEKFNMDTQLQDESIKQLPPPTTFKYVLTAHNGVKKII